MRMSIIRAADILLGGGVIAYPTETVFGLGCLPDDADAVQQLLAIKRRSPAKGLILLASHGAQLENWVNLADGQTIPEPKTVQPITWIVPAKSGVNSDVQGDNKGLAVRITSNRTAAAICDAVESPIVSTSANFTGRPTARNRIALRRQFGRLVDYIVPGDCGPASGPSEIRSLITGETIRPRKA